MRKHQILLLLGFCLLLSGCALNEIARKEDIAVAKTDLADEIIKARNENRMLSERLEATTRRVEELTNQIEATKLEGANSAKFIQERLGQLNDSISEAKKDQEKISSDFSAKIQVVLDEVSKENASLHEKIDKLGQAKKSQRAQRAVSQDSGNTYTVAAGDTLAKISKRCKVSIETLLELNHLENPDSLKAGQRLALPSNTDNSKEKL